MLQKIKSLADQHGTPLLLFSANEFKKSYRELQSFLPNVKHHYALKPLPLAETIDCISECNGYLDIASVGELKLVAETNPSMLAKCIYTHPVKKVKDIQSMLEHGVSIMVADNLAELQKLALFPDRINILIRLAFPNQDARCNLSEKFGADEKTFRQLIQFAHYHSLKIIGCSFHVGSQMSSPFEFVHAIKTCKELYNWCKNEYDLDLKVLDIGGGFPAEYIEEKIDLEQFCKPIKIALDTLFPTTEIWSEPGRCVASNSMMAITRVIGKVYKNGRVWYYLDDGIYSTFSGKLFDQMKYTFHPLLNSNQDIELSVIAGPTCDSIDIIERDVMIQSLEVGDYLVTARIGAYGYCSRTQFNLLEEAKIIRHNFELNEIEQEFEQHLSNLQLELVA